MDNLKLINMRDVERENVTFLWNPYIPLGKISIVQGDPGCGKTTMLLAVAAAITNGQAIAEGGSESGSPRIEVSWGEGAALPPSNVIFQTAEDGLADTIKPRLEELGADCSKVHVIDESEFTLSLDDDRIKQAIISTGAKLVCIDPLQAYLGGADMHSANGVRPLMKRLAAVAEDTGAAIVLIGHLNKRSGKSAYRGLGSIDIYAAARSVLTVGKIDVDECMRAVVHGKSNLAPNGNSFAFGLDPLSGFTWLGDYDITLDELLDDKQKKNDGGMLLYATGFLKGEIVHGDIAATDIYKRADMNGIPRRTLERAKSNLNVKSYKQGNQWFWTAQAAEPRQHRQDSNMTELATLAKMQTEVV
jgi:hypothetical protein